MKTCSAVVAFLAILATPPAMAQSTQVGDPPPGTVAAQPFPAEPPVLFHFTGYADATYIHTQGDSGSAGVVTLAPILHVQFADKVFVETELELESDEHGATNTAFEYAAFNWLLNDHAALVLGKFLSPVGYFFPNMHPSWINKMVSAPAGFGHGGAAPISDVGAQLRGGKTFANGQHLNYAVYIGNGPRLGVEHMEDIDLDLEGSTHNPDGRRVTGGRIGWMPIPSLELGASYARGNVVLDPGTMSEMSEPSRTYRVEGIDFAWRASKGFNLHGEWIRQRVGEAAASMLPERAMWRAWYLQGDHRFGADHWEAVLRYSDSVSPHAEATFKQTALGLNYLFGPRAQLKLTREFNDSADPEANADRVLLQLAYGF